MANFDAALPTVLAHEGGYTVDHAGPTNYGVTLATLRRQGDLDCDGFLDGDLDRDGDVDTDDIRAMTPGDAADIYRVQWWDRHSYSLIGNQSIATKIFDLSVNMGPRQAHLILQRALRATEHEVVEDGILGPKTREAVNRTSGYSLLPALRSEAAGFYRALVERNKSKYGRFLTGWLKRAYS